VAVNCEPMKNWNLKTLFIGRALDSSDRSLCHKMSLVAALAWVGLGADGLSSSCYGPEETFRSLGAHPALSVFVAFACMATIIICASYRQIIELFPSGGWATLAFLGQGPLRSLFLPCTRPECK
jgi:hypothetical protein